MNAMDSMEAMGYHPPLLATNQVLAYIGYASLAGILAIGCLSRPMIRIRYAMARVVANKG